jgi:hypothetical protein
MEKKKKLIEYFKLAYFLKMIFESRENQILAENLNEKN